MPEPAVTAQVHQPFDVHGNLRAKLPFYLEVTIDDFTNAVDLSLGEIIRARIRINLELVQDPIGSSPADTIDIGQTDFYPFASR